MAVVASRTTPSQPDVDLSTTLAGIEFAHPVFTASGCAAAGQELGQFFDVSTIGAITTKSIMLNARSGRPTPRMAETPSGMLNAIGLQGPGVEVFLAKDLPWLVDHGARAVVSIAGSTVEEYSTLTQKLRGKEGITAIEVNISCPNVESRGQVFACDPVASAAVLKAVRKYADVPILAKLSPDVTDIVAIARACVDNGADGLSLINTLLGLVIDTRTMRPHLGGITGGLSGPAIRPVAVRAVWQVRQALPDVPILGMGGIRTGRDALEFLLAGADAVSVGTVIFNDPMAPVRIGRELAAELAGLGVHALRDVIGAAHGRPTADVVGTADAFAATPRATQENA